MSVRALSFRAAAVHKHTRESVGGGHSSDFVSACVCRAWSWPGLDSYLVDPASNICLFQRLSHACLRISELIQ